MGKVVWDGGDGTPARTGDREVWGGGLGRRGL